MNASTATYGHVTLDAAKLSTALAVESQDNKASIRLTSYSEPMMVYVEGTADELAAFVHDLAAVVRDLLITASAVTPAAS